MLQPIPSAAVVILGLAAMVANGTPMREALGGYAEPSVWLVLVAMIMARVLMDTGAAHRIALFFIRQFGQRSLGVSYALVLTDVTLAGGRAVDHGPFGGHGDAGRQGDRRAFRLAPRPDALRGSGASCSPPCIRGRRSRARCILTGQASNLLGAGLALKLVNVEVTWSSWFVAAIVPGIVSCAVVPWIVYRVVPPEITSTPQASEFARANCRARGR